jgi:phosphate transport system permease protein
MGGETAMTIIGHDRDSSDQVRSALPAGWADARPIGTGDADVAVVTAGSAPPLSIDVSGPAGGHGTASSRLGDRLFRTLAAGSGALIVALVALIGGYLLIQAAPSIAADRSNFLFSSDWNLAGGTLRFGVARLLRTTVLVSAIAMLIAVPMAVGIALFITQYAPSRLARPVAYVIDLLAAIPSIIYGIWGILVLAPALEPAQRALYHLSAIPLFKDGGVLRGSIFDAGVVLAIMVLPIATAVCRDVFERTPQPTVEAALALGATRWETIRLTVLPHGRAGIVSGAMLGLGRALGETVAMYFILSAPGAGSPFSTSIFSGGETFASKIANNAAEFGDPRSTGAYIAAGLVLFVLTFVVNSAARAIVNRRREFTS